jgi:hypothetical protein
MINDASVIPLGAVPFDSTLSDIRLRGRVSRDVPLDTVDGREW